MIEEERKHKTYADEKWKSTSQCSWCSVELKARSFKLNHIPANSSANRRNGKEEAYGKWRHKNLIERFLFSKHLMDYVRNPRLHAISITFYAKFHQPWTNWFSANVYLQKWTKLLAKMQFFIFKWHTLKFDKVNAYSNILEHTTFSTFVWKRETFILLTMVVDRGQLPALSPDLRFLKIFGAMSSNLDDFSRSCPPIFTVFNTKKIQFISEN